MATLAQSLEEQFKQFKEKATLMQEEELRNKMTVKTVLLCWNRLRQQPNPAHPLGLLPKMPVMKILHAGGYIGDIYAEVTQEQLQNFLNQVAAGQQDEAEILLRQHPNLALASGNVTDLSNRTFQGITAFQYAIWALDWHMWKMIKKYLPFENAREQVQGITVFSWVTIHGVHAGNTIQTLIDAIDRQPSWSIEQYHYQWIHKVGEAQRSLPMHVLHEYCRPDRSFEPTPSFTEDALPRMLNYYDYNDSKDKILNLPDLGSNFGFFRGMCLVASGDDGYVARCWLECDQLSCIRLLNVRTNQRDELIATLTQGEHLQPGATNLKPS